MHICVPASSCIDSDIAVNISEVGRIGNDLADAIAKEAFNRFSHDPHTLERFVKAERAVTALAKWIGILRTLDIDDDCERPQQGRIGSRRLGRNLLTKIRVAHTSPSGKTTRSCGGAKYAPNLPPLDANPSQE